MITAQDAGYEQVTEDLLAFGRKLGLRHFTVAVERATDEADGILRYAGMAGADLIAICTHGEKSRTDVRP